MAAVAKAPHQVGNKIMILPDEYTNIGTVCGVSKLTGPPAAGSETIRVSAAIEAGLVRRATVRLDNKKIKSVVMLAANSPQVGALVGQTLGSNKITSAYFSQRIELG